MSFQRFYPSISSVATHFKEYRATALGVAVAGSSAGGIIFPIMLRRLFVQIGFSNTIRISGLLSLLCCGVAVFTITSLHPPSPTPFKLKYYTSCFKDSRYLLLLIGSALVSFGMELITSHMTLRLTSEQASIFHFSILSTLCKIEPMAPGLPRTTFPRTFWRS